MIYYDTMTGNHQPITMYIICTSWASPIIPPFYRRLNALASWTSWVMWRQPGRPRRARVYVIRNDDIIWYVNQWITINYDFTYIIYICIMILHLFFGPFEQRFVIFCLYMTCVSVFACWYFLPGCALRSCPGSSSRIASRKCSGSDTDS